MMAYYGEARTKGTTESGRLVWVHRRNGTWWPGQILSTDQVPESSMSSRRSGTPVKLLGREHPIVEFFNVETSKRIKEFRCGEFNECIEKAEACSDNLAKRAVNYARKEDAILHALQLERVQKSKDKLEQEMEEYFLPSASNKEIEQKCILSYKVTNSIEQITQNKNIISQYTLEDNNRTKRKRKLTPHAKEFWKEKGILSEEPSVKRHHPGFPLSCGSHTSQKRKVGCQGHQVEVQYFGLEDFNNSGRSTSGAATTIILGSRPEKGSEPQDVDAESCLYSKSFFGIYDSASKLFEVDVEANRDYKSQNVPYICLESRLNGWSFFGHPLDVEVLDDGSDGDLLSGSGHIGSSDEGDNAQKNHADRRSHGKHDLYKPHGPSRFMPPCPSAPKKLRSVSSLLASDDTRLPQIIPEFNDLKNPSLHCVPVKLIRSRLKEALR